MIHKKALSERDICTRFITPAIKNSGWNLTTQVREEVNLTNGRIIFSDNPVSRGKNKRADYILYQKQLRECYCKYKAIEDTPHALIKQDYYPSFEGKGLCYYQINVVNRTIADLKGPGPALTITEQLHYQI